MWSRPHASSVVAVLVALAAFRVLLPVAVIAAGEGGLAPGLPGYSYDSRPGDAFGYHAAVRELLSVPPRLGWALPGVLVLIAALPAVVRRWRRHPAERAWLTVAGAWCVGGIAALFVLRMRASGAPIIGWPLIWSVPLFPYRALGLPLDPDRAFVFAAALSVAANAVTVVATYAAGFFASGRRAVGLTAAALYALWPLVAPVVAVGDVEDTWLVDLGVHAYSEPVSTALVTTALALLLRAETGPVGASVAGALLGVATAARLSNAIVAGVAVAVLLALRSRALGARAACAGLAFLPVVIAHWPSGYASLPETAFRDDAFGVAYAAAAWRDSEVWGIAAFVLLVPLACLGTTAVSRLAAVLLWPVVVGTALFYTFYWYTPLHPRFLLVALPPLLVLWGAGVVTVAERLLRLHRPVVDLRG